ncbi:MAG: orotidine-5'-phosphate decarboxylase [Lachnospiraceae bacterium]|nr:orotidine-5'-phosphate decarboxylase [Lachnospiraceae bacterium]
MNKEVIVACDFNSKEELIKFLSLFTEESVYLKVGMELFYAEGPAIIKEIKSRGHKIFLDLKLHDIPNTVKKAMNVLSKLDVDMVNVHAAGTIAMMEAAIEGLTKEDGTRPLIIAVTQLTSTSEERMRDDLLIEKPIEDVVLHYAMNTKRAGLDGIVCSAHEAKKIHRECGEDFLTITPGIRFADSNVGDQVRVMTPEQAKVEGADYIVVGRPITQADNPVEAYHRCKKEFCS